MEGRSPGATASVTLTDADSHMTQRARGVRRTAPARAHAPRPPPPSPRPASRASLAASSAPSSSQLPAAPAGAAGAAPGPLGAAKARTVTEQVQRTVAECFKRSSSCAETKYRITITSDRLAQLRKNVEAALREHKVFTIRGCWPVIRRELLNRNWIEKFESGSGARGKPPASAPPTGPIGAVTIPPLPPAVAAVSAANSDELTSNLPVKQDWESPAAYTQKCERTVMSRMLQSYDVDLYWSMRKDHSDLQHRANSYKLINRFCRSLFASKEGLALLLQQAYWFTEPGVSHINFPRCYVLGFPDHYNYFVDDFRLTACMGLIKWFMLKYEKEDKYSFQSPEGAVPYTALQFAIDRCSDYVMSQKHVDIDKEETRVWTHEWDQFLTQYGQVVHRQQLFLESKKWSTAALYTTARNLMSELTRRWPEMDTDGMRNIWIMKPGNKCRGRGIQLIRDIADVDKVMNLKLKYVVQKYIEKPFIIYKTKFDIRQWFIVTSVQPLIIWMYRDSYLRFSSQTFTLDNFHESLHLTNYAVQCKYTNVEHRDKALPDDNMWDCHKFREYLNSTGHAGAWETVIYPGMKEAIVCAMLCSQDTMDRRSNTFEVYGADFMLSEDLKPWLLEINCCPDLSSSTSVTKKMCPRCMEDVIKVVVDRRRDPKADTGLFDLVYKQNLPKTPPYLGMNLSIRGRRLFRRSRNKNKADSRYVDGSDFMGMGHSMDDALSHDHMMHQSHLCVYNIDKRDIMQQVPKMLSDDIYSGPVITDLVENLYAFSGLEGVDFVAARATRTSRTSRGQSNNSNNPPAEKKKKSGATATAAKRERVPRRPTHHHHHPPNAPHASSTPATASASATASVARAIMLRLGAIR